MATVTVIMYPGAVEFMKSWEGEIGRHISRLCDQVKDDQKVLAPKKTGRLAASISVDKGRGVSGIQATIGAHGKGLGYAMYMEEGTRPHSIRPRNPAGFMKFYWPKVGHVVWFKHVSHPGNHAYHWAYYGLVTGMASEGYL